MSVKVIDSFRLVVAKKGAANIGTVEADADNDTLTLEAGTGINFTVDANNDTITIINEQQSEALLAARSPIYIRADDSAIVQVGPGENFGILGGGVATTASNAEGDITITVPATLSSYTNDPGFITGDNLGDRADVVITSVADNDLLQYDTASGEWQNKSITNAGFATVSTTGVYGDLTTRPNITFTGDVTGGTGGQLAGGASNIAMTLANSGITAGTYSGFTVDAKGRITAFNQADASSETLTSVTNRNNETTNSITVGGLSIGTAYSLPTSIGSDGTVLKVNNGVLQFLPGGSEGALRIVADDSTERTISAGEILQVVGAGPVATSTDAEGKLTIDATPTIDQVLGYGNTTTKHIKVGNLTVGNFAFPTTLGADGTILKVNNGVLQFIAEGNNDSFALRVVADDSTERFINPGEQFAIVGGGNVTTSTDIEGKLTITSSPDLDDVLANGNTATTDVAFNANVTLGDNTNDLITMNGALAGRFPLSFEGQTDNNIFTRFEITDPTTSTKTITFPDATGTVAFTNAELGDFQNSANFVTSSDNIASATKLQTARNFSITGAVTAGAVSFDGTGNVVLTTSFANQNISQFINDSGFVTDGLTTSTPVSTLPNDVGYMTKWSIGADDSTMREVRADENIKILGSGAVTTSSDAEGNITVAVSNDLSTYNNDAGFNTQNDTITLTGDVSGSGRTTINTTLNVALSNVTPGSYNYVTVDTKGIVQDAEVKPYTTVGSGISQFINDAGYITSLGTSLRFVGDDSTGFGVPIPGNDIRFQGAGGVTVAAANEAITITGPLDANGLLTADVQGSVFADDSTTVIQGDTGHITTPVATINEVLNLGILSTAPTSPANGMVAIADGSGWDPLSNATQSMVVYLGGAWRQLAIASV